MAKRRTNVMNRRAPQAVLAAVFAFAIISAAFWAGFGLSWKATAYGNVPFSSPDGTTLVATNKDYASGSVAFDWWTDCTGAGLTAAQLDTYCSCKGYGKAYKCWFTSSPSVVGFKAAAAPGCGEAVGSPNDGTGLVAIACQTSVCGNGVAEDNTISSELCDGNDLKNKNCTDAGNFTGGTLACNAACNGYVTSGCTYTPPPPPPAPSWCGDGKVNSTESCDGNNFTGKSCVSLGYTGGNLTCSADCKTIVTSSCTAGTTAVCGNNKIETGEECDGTKFGGDSCLAEGFTGGSLTCTDCTIDTSTCSNYECGNKKIEPGEDCDGTKLGGKTCKNLGEGFTGGTLVCADECIFDTSGCIETPAVTAADALVAINDAQNAITNATNAKKNVTIAIAKFNSAVTAYNTGDYEQSKADALAAKLDANIAPSLQQPGPEMDLSSLSIIAATIGAVAAAFYFLKAKHLRIVVKSAAAPQQSTQPGPKQPVKTEARTKKKPETPSQA